MWKGVSKLQVINSSSQLAWPLLSQVGINELWFIGKLFVQVRVGCPHGVCIMGLAPHQGRQLPVGSIKLILLLVAEDIIVHILRL